MITATPKVDCRWCAGQHTARFLCDPAKRILDALYARGMEGNMEPIEFPAPIPAQQMGLGLEPDDRLLRQLVVKAGTAEAAGVARPVLVFTGQDHTGRPLPQWTYVGDDEDMRRTAALVEQMAALAMTTAARQRARG